MTAGCRRGIIILNKQEFAHGDERTETYMESCGIDQLLGALPQKKDLIEFRGSAQLPLYRSAFRAVVAALEARDPYTAHHSDRVSQMAESFVEVLHLPAYLRVLTGIVGSVHDIGKIGVPDAVLFKQGKLTDEEWAVMRRHPVIGEQIILQAGDLQNVAQAVRSHHERWDGRGYPDGLSGRDIPYISRILAVCDSTDAMMSTRVYRPSLGREKCMRELADNAGTMYQRELADIFLENWDKIVGRLYEESVD